MSKKILYSFSLFALAMVFAGCQAVTTTAPAVNANTNTAPALNVNTNTAPALNVNTTTAPEGQQPVGLANPASVNCGKQGGVLKLETKTYQGQDLGQVGVCYFGDNQQCEEWAMMRGECPVGGVRVKVYTTEAGRYCAITGGKYDITVKASGGALEQGTCSKAGKICEAWKYYDGECQTGE